MQNGFDNNKKWNDFSHKSVAHEWVSIECSAYAIWTQTKKKRLHNSIYPVYTFHSSVIHQWQSYVHNCICMTQRDVASSFIFPDPKRYCVWGVAWDSNCEYDIPRSKDYGQSRHDGLMTAPHFDLTLVSTIHNGHTDPSQNSINLRSCCPFEGCNAIHLSYAIAAERGISPTVIMLIISITLWWLST